MSPPVRQLHKDRLSRDQRPVSQCLPRCFCKCTDRRSDSTRVTKAGSSLNTSRRDKPGGQCDHRAFVGGELASQAGVATAEWAWNRVGVHGAVLCTRVCAGHGPPHSSRVSRCPCRDKTGGRAARSPSSGEPGGLSSTTGGRAREQGRLWGTALSATRMWEVGRALTWVPRHRFHLRAGGPALPPFPVPEGQETRAVSRKLCRTERVCRVGLYTLRWVGGFLLARLGAAGQVSTSGRRSARAIAGARPCPSETLPCHLENALLRLPGRHARVTPVLPRALFYKSDSTPHAFVTPEKNPQ